MTTTIDQLQELHESIWAHNPVYDRFAGQTRFISKAKRPLTTEEWEMVKTAIKELNLIVLLYPFGFFNGIQMILKKHPEVPGLKSEVKNIEWIVFSVCHNHLPGGKELQIHERFDRAFTAFMEIAQTERNHALLNYYNLHFSLRKVDYEY